MVYHYSNTSTQTTVAAYLSPTATTINVTDATGLPVAYPYTLVVDYGQTAVEVMTVTGTSGDGLAVTRGEDGTAAQEHQVGAAVVHAIVARDVAGPQAHVTATSGVHGVTGAVAGVSDTQTLTNKSIDGSHNTLTNIPDSAIVSISASKIVGDLSAPAVLTGAISCTSLAATGSITGASVTASGALSGASGSISGNLTAGSATVSGSVTVSGSLSAGSFSVSSLSATSMTLSSSLTAASASVSNGMTANGGGNTIPFYSNIASANTAPFVDLLNNGNRVARIRADGTHDGTDFAILNGRSLPRGVVYCSVKTTDLHNTIGTTETTVWGPVTVALQANRTYKVMVTVNVSTSAETNQQNYVWLYKDSSHVSDTGVIITGQQNYFVRGRILYTFETGTSGLSPQFSLSAFQVQGTQAFDVKATSNHPFVFLIEDIGPSGVIVAT